ncbi:hypothetical protein ABPG72_019135 [Tetrahymena utriculariae]
MNKILIAIVILGVCTAANIKCTAEQKKAKFCTMEYMPVCGVKIDSKDRFSQTFATYGNKCSACAAEGVEFYITGECEQYPKEATFCHPDAHLSKACTREYFPVCGLFDQSIQCFRFPCGMNYSNKCSACINEHVAYLVPGDCEQMTLPSGNNSE